mmetsp:Transcript_12481/g.37493  ORF Transcript_12481/g.37493 Transcript_12481/m.37493 type:complete len:301 (-) Transcript_12481:1291-2193(-)
MQPQDPCPSITGCPSPSRQNVISSAEISVASGATESSSTAVEEDPLNRPVRAELRALEVCGGVSESLQVALLLLLLPWVRMLRAPCRYLRAAMMRPAEARRAMMTTAPTTMPTMIPPLMPASPSSTDDRMVEPAADAVPSSALAAATRPMGPSPPTLVTNPLSSSIPVMLSFSVPSSSICTVRVVAASKRAAMGTPCLAAASWKLGPFSATDMICRGVYISTGVRMRRKVTSMMSSCGSPFSLLRVAALCTMVCAITFWVRTVVLAATKASLNARFAAVCRSGMKGISAGPCNLTVRSIL